MTMLTESDLQDMQRLVLEGYPARPAARYMLFEITDPYDARENLVAMLDPNNDWIGTADRASRQRDKEFSYRPRLSIAFTMAGFRALGLGEGQVHNLPLAFLEGMRTGHRARRLHDPAPGAPGGFEWGDDRPDLHGMFMLFSPAPDYPDNLTRHEARAQQLTNDWADIQTTSSGAAGGAFGFRIIHTLPDAWIREDLKDHFNFRDGISQPYIDGSQTSRRPKGKFTQAHIVKPGEIVLGHPNESTTVVPPLWIEYSKQGDPNAAPPADWEGRWLDVEGIGPGRRDFGRNGTYVAFRQMRQKTSEFETYLNSVAWASANSHGEDSVNQRGFKGFEGFFVDDERGIDAIFDFDAFLRGIAAIYLKTELHPFNEQIMAAAKQYLEPEFQTEIRERWLDRFLTLNLALGFEPELRFSFPADNIDTVARQVLERTPNSAGRLPDLGEEPEEPKWKLDPGVLAPNIEVLIEKITATDSGRTFLDLFRRGPNDEEPIIFPHRDAGVRRLHLLVLGNARCFLDNDRFWAIRLYLRDGFGPPITHLIQAVQGPNDAVAAKFIGRWRSGAPLVKAADADKPWLEDENDFMFLPEDRYGYRCPIGAHIRRANPRDALANERRQVTPKGSLARSRRARIVRRGRPYTRAQDDVGIHFIALNANLRDQFEFVLINWVNKDDFSGLRDEVDPLMGTPREPGGQRNFTIQSPPVSDRLTGLADFVEVKGGGYFFLPSIKALRFLARLPYP